VKETRLSAAVSTLLKIVEAWNERAKLPQQVPYRNVFSLETVGDKPSLRLEVNIADAKTMYPIDETPAILPGFNFVKVRISGKGKYDARNKPYIDFRLLFAVSVTAPTNQPPLTAELGRVLELTSPSG
jgi:hypothetical protein